MNPTLIFLHFFGGSSRSWTPVIALLDNDFRCVAPDLGGFGGSPNPKNGFSVDDYADEIAALIAKLGLEKFVLIGHSMGGKIALALAARQPDGLEKLVLLAPSPPSPEPMEESERQRLLNGFGKREVAIETLGKITVSPLPNSLRENTIEEMLRVSHEAWRAWLESGSREDISARMNRIEVPITIAAGENDSAMTPELLQREIVARVKNASVEVVPNVSHLVPLEAPEIVAELIRFQ